MNYLVQSSSENYGSAKSNKIRKNKIINYEKYLTKESGNTFGNQFTTSYNNERAQGIINIANIV